MNALFLHCNGYDDVNRHQLSLSFGDCVVQQSNIPVRVKNSFNKNAVGTVITSLTSPDSSTSLLTSIVIKKNVTLFDIVSTRMLGQYGFLAKVFGVFERNEISVDVVATSEVSNSNR